MFISCPCTRASGQLRVWSDPSGPSRCRQRSARGVVQHQARDQGLVLHRTGRQRGLWAKSRELGVVPGRQAETAALARGVRKGTRRRESELMTGLHAWRATVADQPGQYWARRPKEP